MIGVTDISYILHDIEDRLPELPDVTPVRFDKWIVSSATQKSIRRGQVDIALNCAGSLWQMDRQMLWRRICVTALEDIGIGDIGTVSETLAICSNWKWRRRVGDLKAALYIVERMAQATKSRSITHTYMMAEMSPHHHEARETYAGLEDRALAKTALDPTHPLINRTIALWYLAGHHAYPSDTLHQRDGNLDMAKKIMAKLNAPYPFTQTCMLNMKKMRWPGPLIAPLVYEVFGEQEAETIEHDLPAPILIEGMPTYACDGLYTRTGKLCVKQWRNECSVLSPYTLVQLGHALFYTESEQLNKERVSDSLWSLKRDSTQASLLRTGVAVSGQEELLGAVRKHLPQLHNIRKQQLRKSVTSNPDLFTQDR